MMKRTAREIAVEIVEIAEGDVQSGSVVVGQMIADLVRSGEYAADEIGEIVAVVVDTVSALNVWRSDMGLPAI